MIKILNSELKPVAVLKTVINPVVIDEINREFTCSFTTVIDGEKSQYINYLHKVETDNNYFNIMYTKENHNSDGSLTINVECEHVSYELNDNDNILDYFTAYGTPTELLTLLLYGTDFTIGQVQFTEPITISINEKCTKRGVLFAIADALGAEVEFNKYQISLLTARGEDRGVCFRYRKNLLNVSRTTDAREKIDGLPLVTYEIDVAELEFAEGYGSDWHYETGDIVRVFDAELGINNLPLRIIKESHNPNNRMQGTVVVSNIKDAFIHDIYDTLTSLQQSTIIKGNVYNGCKISPENGFEVIRSDNLAKSILNATDGISIFSDTGLGLERNFYVGLDGRIKAKEIDIDGSGTFGGNITAEQIIGGVANLKNSVNIGDVTETTSKGLYFYNYEGNTSLIELQADGSMEMFNYKDLQVWSGERTSVIGMSSLYLSGGAGSIDINSTSTDFLGNVEFGNTVTFWSDVIFYGNITGIWWSDIESNPFGSYSPSSFASSGHSHSGYVVDYINQGLSLVATDDGLVVRVNGVTKGSLFF